jgi:transposase-like protein
MANCPKCQTEYCSKDGIVRGKQCYRCKDCGYRHTVAYKWYSEKDKQRAVAMYLEDLGFRSIGRLLGCSHVAIYPWIKQSGEKARLDRKAIHQRGDRLTRNRNRAMPLEEGH